ERGSPARCGCDRWRPDDRTTSPSLPMTQASPGARLLSHSTGGGLCMQHADGRRSGRRRALVAVVTTAMTVATVLAITAPAHSAGRLAAGRAQASRSAATFDIRARGAAVAPSARVAQARVALARRL